MANGVFGYSRTARKLAGWGLVLAFASFIYAVRSSHAQSGQNPIQAENANQGTTVWQLNNPSSNHEIEGYASAVSINRGESITFFVNTTAPSYTLQVFRMGWYMGAGARAFTQPITLAGIAQPLPTPDTTYGMAECNWTASYTLTTSNSDPSQWVSGVYLAKLVSSSGFDQYIIFVIRDDSRASNLLFNVSVNTYAAYNGYGGKSLYEYNSGTSIPQAQAGGAGMSSAVKVSFNRPYDDGWGTGQFLSYDYDMVGFLESEGYDVTYQTDLDTHLNPSSLLQHKAFLSVGHDEYWTLEGRQNVTSARDAGVNLGFFGADAMAWQIRYEPSPLSGALDRTVVGYKEDAINDPDAQNPSTYPYITTEFRKPHGNLPGQPEDALIGVMVDYEPVSANVVIVDPSSWVFANTGLGNGDQVPKVLGYEVDREFGDQPSNTVLLAHSPYATSSGATQYADMTIYQAASRAWVFAAGTIEWDWALSDVSPWGPSSSQVDAAAQQTTRNIIGRFISAASPTPTPTFTASSTRSPTPGVTATPSPTESATTSGCVTIVSPVMGAIVSGASIAVKTNDTCKGGWFEVLQIDGKNVGSFAPGKAVFNSTNVANGSHLLTVNSQSENPGSVVLGTASVTVSVANGSPTPTTTKSVTPTATSSRTPTATASPSSTPAITVTPTLAISPTVRPTSTPTNTLSLTTTPTPTPTQSSSPLSTPTPTACIQILSPQNNSIVSGTNVPVSTKDTCGGGWFEALKIDGNNAGAFAPGRVVFNSTAVANGNHTLTVTSQSENPGTVVLGAASIIVDVQN